LAESNRRYIKSLTLDAYGHVTALTTGTETVTDTNTTYSAGTGLTLSSTTFSVSKANASTILNLLDGASANMTSAGYVITSDASNPSDGLFYKRPASSVVNATLVKAALGTGTGTTKYLREDGTWVKPPDNNTTYSAGTGISLSGTTFSNSGVRSVATGSSNGTISVNTNGTAANVAVKGLGSAAYTNSNAYAPSSHSHSYLPLSGGTLTGKLQVNAPIFGYNYNSGGNNVAAFTWDKPGSNYTGMGACGEADTIYFGACNNDGVWVTNYR
jgi:hypothetical protein